MSTLSGQKISQTFGRLIQIDNVGNNGIDSNPRNLQDGGGHNLPIQVYNTGLLVDVGQYVTYFDSAGGLGIYFPNGSNISMNGYDNDIYCRFSPLNVNGLTFILDKLPQSNPGLPGALYHTGDGNLKVSL